MKSLGVSLLVLLAGAVLVAVSSAPVYAVDGVVLINQNTVTSGLPGCPTGGTFPIIICNPGSYRLSSDLAVTVDKDGIDINASNVTLDLNGFSIAPDGGFSFNNGNGIYSAASHNITIENGKIEGFAGSPGVNITTGTVTGPGAAISLGGFWNVIDRVAVFNNSIGVYLVGGGLITRSSNVSSFVALVINSSGAGNLTNNLVKGLNYAVVIGAGAQVGYGSNTLIGTISGGTSMGDNVCGSVKC